MFSIQEIKFLKFLMEKFQTYAYTVLVKNVKAAVLKIYVMNSESQ